MTNDEKQFLQNKSKEMGFSSMTAFIMHCTETYFRVDIDMSVYQKLSLEVNYIGKNINNLIRKIFTDKIYTDSDLDLLIDYLEKSRDTN